MTFGGDSWTQTLIINEDIAKEIINKLKKSSKTQAEIAKEFNVSTSIISDINQGKTWRQDENYPIRKNNSTNLTESDFLEIIKLLYKNTMSENEISKKYNISNSIISKINTGNYKKFQYPKFITFPIRKEKIVSKTIISQMDILNLLEDYLTLNLTKTKLANKYKISKSYVKSIYLGYNAKIITKQLIFPLKQHKKDNLFIINKLKTSIV